ncbi:MAG: hypothetical protein FJ171_00995 [Gammaproteobacteria bacterium]|nr:hypothetical protein [Gammaproteobacteria bacterium]
MSTSTPESKIELIRRLQQAAEQRDKVALLAFSAPDIGYHYHFELPSALAMATRHLQAAADPQPLLA